MNKWCEKEIEELISLTADITDQKEIEALFDKIFTPREINDAAKRLLVIKMLEAGESYSNISMRLSMSPSTISKISLGLGYGFRRTDEKVLAKIKPKEKTKLPTIVETGVSYKGVPTYKIKFQ